MVCRAFIKHVSIFFSYLWRFIIHKAEPAMTTPDTSDDALLGLTEDDSDDRDYDRAYVDDVPKETNKPSRLQNFLAFFNVYAQVTKLNNFYQNRPDLMFLTLSIISITGVICILWGMDMYDHFFGYLAPLKGHLKLIRELGIKGITQLQDPDNEVHPSNIYKTIQDAAKLSDAQILQVKIAIGARKAHDQYFKIRPFHNDPLDDILQMALKMQLMLVIALILIVMWPFFIGYFWWIVIRFWKVLITRIIPMFFLEVCIKFFMDWIVAEVKKVFAAIINMIIKILTFGMAKGNTIKVTMPEFSGYVNTWWAKYVAPVVNDTRTEYLCKIQAKTKYVRNAIRMLITPYQNLVRWFHRLKARGIDIPFAEFRELVLKSYPGFVTSHAEYVTDLTDLDARFFTHIKKAARAKATPATVVVLPKTGLTKAPVTSELSQTPATIQDLSPPMDATSAVVDMCPVIL